MDITHNDALDLIFVYFFHFIYIFLVHLYFYLFLAGMPVGGGGLTGKVELQDRGLMSYIPLEYLISCLIMNSIA